MNIDKKIEKHLGRKVDFWSEVILQDDGEGVFIKEWNAPEPEPTIADLDKIDVAAEVALFNVHDNRRKEYPKYNQIIVALAEKAEGDSTMWDEITAKRAAVKTKWPKDNSGPVE